MASLFKRAAVRGVAHELVNKGVCEFPSKEAMDAAADAVADGPAMEHAPEVSGEQGHSPEELAEAAHKLMEIAQALMAEAHGAHAGGAGGPPPAEAAEALKQSSYRDLGELAGEAAVSVMEKAAEEVKESSDPKLVGEKEHSNKLTDATGHDSVAKLDEKHRPQGKYQVAMGDTGLDASKGEIGHLGSPTVAPNKSPGGSNSITAGTKKAALRAALEKQANKLVGLHEAPKNNLANSPDPLAKLDEKHRPEGYAHVGQGNTNFSEPQSARIGLEKKPDVTPNKSPGGTNSVVAASKAASEMTEAEQAAYLEAFSKTASDVGPYLPATLTEDEKIAAIEQMIEMDHGARQAAITELHKQASEGSKTGGLMDKVREIASQASAK